MVKRIAFLSIMVAGISFFLAPAVFAAEEISEAAYSYAQMVGLGCVLGLSIAAFGGALSMATAIKAALEGIARNPGTAGKITTTLLIGLALIESLVIYTLVVALILLFVKPYL